MTSDRLYSELFEAQQTSIYRLALMLCGSPHVAEEIVAEVFAKVLPKWRQGSVTDPVFYLRRAIVNEVRSRHRRRVNEQRALARHASREETTIMPSPATALSQPLIVAMQQLSVRHRAVIVLRFHDDLSEARGRPHPQVADWNDQRTNQQSPRGTAHTDGGTAMTDTDIEYGNRIGSGLKDASASFSPPGGMFLRVGERERQHDRRRASVRVGALGLAAVVTLGGLAWVRLVRTDESTAANQPVQVPSTLTASANADRIDAYPIINWPGDPLPNVRADYGTHDDDQGWGGTIGVLHADGVPTSVVAVHVFPAGWDTAFPDSRPGRVAGVEETAVTNGNTTLTWRVGDIPVVATGDDVDLMYQLVDLVEPIAATVQRGGYQFNGPLPNGSSELEAPYHRIAMRSPLVSNDDGTFSVAVEQGPVLDVLVGGGSTTLDRMTINGLNGYKSTTGDPTIALAITSDETLYLSARTLTMEQLTAIAQGVTITDGASWRAHYELTD